MTYLPPITEYSPKTRAREPKYRNKKVQFKGLWFDSIGERDRWIALCQMEQDGQVRNLRRQVRYRLDVFNDHICDYIADFTYEDCTNAGDWVFVVEDFKGIETDVFKLKSRLMKAIHGVDIMITKRTAWRSQTTFGKKSWKKK